MGVATGSLDAYFIRVVLPGHIQLASALQEGIEVLLVSLDLLADRDHLDLVACLLSSSAPLLVVGLTKTIFSGLRRLKPRFHGCDEVQWGSGHFFFERFELGLNLLYSVPFRR